MIEFDIVIEFSQTLIMSKSVNQASQEQFLEVIRYSRMLSHSKNEGDSDSFRFFYGEYNIKEDLVPRIVKCIGKDTGLKKKNGTRYYTICQQILL